MNFVFDVNRVTHESTVTNRRPAPGEDPVYHRFINDPANRAYALIALRPNLNNSGAVLIFEGTTAAGTEAAADFAFQGQRLSDLIKPGQDGHLPNFELLLQTTNIGDSAPESKVIGYRVYR